MYLLIICCLGRNGKGVVKLAGMRSLCRQEKKELRVLADDFRLLDRKDVQEIIETCESYAEGQRKIMRIYMAVYMSK